MPPPSLPPPLRGHFPLIKYSEGAEESADDLPSGNAAPIPLAGTPVPRRSSYTIPIKILDEHAVELPLVSRIA